MVTLVSSVIKVATDEPFTAAFGRVEDAWNACAETLKRLDGAEGQECRRVQLDGDKLRRFVATMVDKAKKDDLDSLRASGVDEDFDDLKTEVTDLIAMLDDHETERMTAKSSEAAKKAADAAKSATMREAAMQRLEKKPSMVASKTSALRLLVRRMCTC